MLTSGVDVSRIRTTTVLNFSYNIKGKFPVITTMLHVNIFLYIYLIGKDVVLQHRRRLYFIPKELFCFHLSVLLHLYLDK